MFSREQGTSVTHVPAGLLQSGHLLSGVKRRGSGTAISTSVCAKRRDFVELMTSDRKLKLPDRA